MVLWDSRPRQVGLIATSLRLSKSRLHDRFNHTLPEVPPGRYRWPNAYSVAEAHDVISPRTILRKKTHYLVVCCCPDAVNPICEPYFSVVARRHIEPVSLRRNRRRDKQEEPYKSTQSIPSLAGHLESTTFMELFRCRAACLALISSSEPLDCVKRV